ncbi:polyketide cyclase/dehydrase/lipid transport protein [Yoonia maricola]|uniref:Polyketide cyclase/dehydrase/lipid transport protein n=1 Tax=Yoonia maricola TaxID=420999 RepID=A0A2M8WP98_9RHOB|nr:SRPBCC family protein [Yoonia maricola]PJI92762.1 polyketide cyclase/dehydrase/lipid transport protein [Yoonia maricola]
MKTAFPARAILAAFAISLAPLPALAADVPPAPALSRAALYQSNTLFVVLEGDLAEVRAFMDANPLTDFLEPSGRIPRITDVVVLDGNWGDVNSLRRVDLEGGFHVHERVLTNDEDEFTYQIWDISTDAGRFISHIYGEIRLSEDPDGTRLTWSYNIKPRYFFARPSIRSYLNDDFAPFMQNGLTGFATAYAAQS